jgi:hypothetical protein
MLTPTPLTGVRQGDRLVSIAGRPASGVVRSFAPTTDPLRVVVVTTDGPTEPHPLGARAVVERAA